MIVSIISLLRVRQWTKNVFVLVVPFFGGELFNATIWPNLAIAFVASCLASSIVYVINDLADRNVDKANLKFKIRPLASGEISIWQALSILAVLATILFTISLTTSLSPVVSGFLYFYILINILYSLCLKFIAILEIFVVSSGFVLRLLVGAAATDLEPSLWVTLLTWLLSLFIVICKRLAELEQGNTRIVNASYSREFLTGLLFVITAVTTLVYVMFCIDPVVVERFGRYIGVTIPIVMFGLFQYIRLLIVQKRYEEPTSLVFLCKELYLTGCIWLIFVSLSIYAHNVSYILVWMDSK